MVSSSPAKIGGAGAVSAIADHARMLETLLGNLPGMVYRCRNDPEWTMIFVSEGCRELTGCTPAELNDNRHTSYGSLIAPEDRAQVWDAVQAALAKHETFELRYRITTAQGRQKWVWERGLGIFGADGAVEHIEGFITDITATVSAERELRDSESRLALVFNASRDMMCLVAVEPGPSFRVVSINEEYVRTVQRTGFNLTAGQLAGQTFDEWKAIFRFPEAAWETLVGRYRRVQESRQPLHFEEVTETPAGKFFGDTWLTPVCDRAGEVEFILYTSTDITDRKRAETALRESEEKSLKAFRATPDAVFITELETGLIVDVNEGGVRLFGFTREEFIGRTTLELGMLRDPADRPRLVAAVKAHGGTIRDFELVERTKAGVDMIMLLSCETIELGGRPHLVTVAHDITARRRAERERAALEAQFRQAQKLEALGQLAGGIAHDFNNILTGILAYAELIALDAERPAEVRKHVGAVKVASQRAGDLVRQILTFSRRQAPERKPVKLSSVIGEALKLIRSTLPKTIEIVDQIDPLAPVVLADATQIHQVVMNLCTNAAHAMQDGPGRLALQLATFDAKSAAGAPPGLEPGRYARLTVSDTGCGMDAATLSHIFEPFFTTKAPGEGTGLGLAVVHGIVEEHDGIITVRSRPGVGTAFDLFFPEFTALASQDAASAAPFLRGQGQRVLFVDDELAIVQPVVQLLTRLGYRPTIHTDPRAAWRDFDAAPAAFDLVVTDLTMPHWTGLELARRILARRPDTPIILTTGHSGAWSVESVRALGLRGMISKPLTSAKLANELHAALAPPPAARP